MRNFLALILVSMLALPAVTLAAEDPPGRVARLSFIEGEVSMAPAGTQEWGEAVLNRPLTSEDRMWVDRDARAELQIGTATIHLDASTEFSFIDLDDDAMTMNLTEGRTTIRILRKREGEEIEINTPNSSISLLHPGEYHIEVDEDGETTIVKARSGEAEVAGEAESYTVKANEIGVFRGSDELTGDISRVGPRTAFENWANDRSRRNERSASSRYVGEGVIGYEDLDEHGRWIHEPQYGYVWQPTIVVAGWAPYRHGRWAWVSPWGWTWIDNARWGFAPFHYGRWALLNHRWCWVPGPRHVRAVYAPALVAWTGGPHVSVNVSIGSGIGWFPLGPREVYVPGYWHTRRHIRSINVSNTVIVNNTYINNAYRGRYRDFDYRYRGRPDAVTVVAREHFVRGQPVNGHTARVDERELRRWNLDARPPAIAPSRDSIRAGQVRTPRHFDTTRGQRQVVARRELPTRVSFDAERRAIEANGGRPVTRTALIDRNPKDRSSTRVARSTGSRIDASQAGSTVRVPTDKGTRQRFNRDSSEERSNGRAGEVRARDAQRRAETRGQAAPGTPVEPMRATQDATRESRSQRASGSAAPAIEVQERARSASRAELESSANSSDLAAQRAQRSQQDQAARESRRIQRESIQRDSVQRGSVRREPAQRERPQQVERPRVERSSPQPERQSQPQTERSQPKFERSTPQPRASGGRSSEPRSSNHMRSGSTRGGGDRSPSQRER
jgi:hypothetical protein